MVIRQGRAKTFGLSQNILKLIACISMTVDHIGFEFFPNTSIFRVIGRLAFPLFAYFIYEGCLHTRNIRKYFVRVFLLGVICFVGYYIFTGKAYGNVLLTFSCSILVFWSSRILLHAFQSKAKLSQIVKGFSIFFVSILILIVSDRLLDLDYGIIGALLPVFPYWFSLLFGRKTQQAALIGFAIALFFLSISRDAIQPFCLFSLPLLLLYNRQRRKGNAGRLFYLFYPGHLAIIGVVAYILK